MEAQDGQLLFGRLVRRHRMRIGFTQRQLADFSTISVRAIRDLEHGRARHPRRDTVRLIADGLRLNDRERVKLEIAAGRGGAGEELRIGFDAAPVPPPVPVGEIVGREAEATALEGILTSRGQRMVTITGIVGAGKTRLALDVAERLHSASGLPVLWASAPTGHGTAGPRPDRDDRLSALVSAAADEIFGAAPTAAHEGEHAGLAGLGELLGDRPALLVLDGTRPEPPDHAKITGLLRGCPGLRLVSTSARPHGIPGERVFLLDPLPLPAEGGEPDAALLRRVASADLFLRHLRLARPRFEPRDEDAPAIAEICRRLDGLPYALESAASWLAVYDPQTLLGLLAEDPLPLLSPVTEVEGGTAVRDALTSSVESLDTAGRDLLRRICETEAGVCGDDLTRICGLPLTDCGRLVQTLMVRGLVRRDHAPGGSRFRALNLVRALHTGHPARDRVPAERAEALV